MPRVIRRALFQKLKELPELLAFQRDFESLSGLKLLFVDDLGQDDGSATELSPICGELKKGATGRVMCGRMRQRLLSQAAEQPACVVCDAGLQEAAVPLRISGIPAGYFLFGGAVAQSPAHTTIHRAAHLLRHHGVELEEDRLRSLLQQSPRMVPEAMEACQRIVFLAARQIALKLTDRLVDPEAGMPPVVVKACRLIRSRGLMEDLGLPVVARECGVSEGHLSRLFHHATGLTFREYLTQLRLEHAKALILHGNHGITEIAYDSGFQSVSQFHRTFRKAYGVAPGGMRRKARSSSSDA